jgi:copper transport protein
MRGTIWRRNLRAVVLVLVLVVLSAVVLHPRPADAHATVVSTAPAAGATVRELDRIVLRFADPVETAGVHLWIEDDGGSFTLGPARHPDGDARAVEVDVPPVASGLYTVGYHVVSADGDVIGGSFEFSLDLVPVDGAAPEPVAAPIPGTSAAPEGTVHQSHGADLPAGAARVLLDAALASLIGGLAFVVTVWPQGSTLAVTRRLLWTAAIVGALASLALAVIQHAAASELGIVSALAPRHLWQSLQFRFGRIALARLVLLCAAAVLTSRLRPRSARSVTWSVPAVAVGMGLFETIALLGHSGQPGRLAEGARLVHSIGVSVWLGGLVMLFLVVLPRRRAEELVDVLPRFSILANLAVGSLVAGGIALSVDLVGAAGSLPTTGYGRVLLLKLAVVAALLVVAQRARRLVRARLAGTSSAGRGLAAASPIATWVGLELGLMAVVFALTALLVSQAPPG